MVNLEFNQNEQDLLNEKFKPETQVDIDEPFYKAAKASMFTVQTISAVLGIGICIHMSNKFPQFKEGIFALFFAFVIGWEFLKRGALNKLQQIRIKNRTKKVKLKAKPYRLASFVFVVGSMFMGFFGAPEVIEEFSTHDQLENLEELRETFFIQIAEVQEEFLSASLASKIEKVTEGLTYNSGKKKGEVKSSAGSLLKELQKGQTEVNVQKNEALSDLRKEMNQAIASSKMENEVIVQKHKAWCKTFGFFAALGNLLCDCILLILLPWCFNHEDRKRKLNDKKKELQQNHQEKEKEPVKENTKKKEAAGQHVTEKAKEQNPIGYAKKEGSFLTENGKKKVLLEMKKGKNKGKLVSKSEQKIKDLISNASNPESKRTKYLETLLNQF
jgi:hypothetical protein